MIELTDKRFNVSQLAAMYLHGVRMADNDVPASVAFAKAATDAGEARLGPILYWLWTSGQTTEWAKDPFSIQEKKR